MGLSAGLGPSRQTSAWTDGHWTINYAPPLMGGGIKRWCASDIPRLSVCLSVAYIGPKSRTERRMKTKIGIEVAQTWLGHHFQGQKVKGQGHQAVLLTAALAHEAAAAVGVGTCWPWETAAILPSARPREALQRPRGGEGRGHIVAAARLQLVVYVHIILIHMDY